MSADISYDNGDLTAQASVRVHFFFFSITIGVTIDFGTLMRGTDHRLPGRDTEPTRPSGASSFPGGVLVLNVGQLAHYRNNDSGNTNEQVVLMGGPLNSDGTQTIYVTIGNYSQAFTNVSKVIIPADGANQIDIANTVHEPLNITAGALGEERDDHRCRQAGMMSSAAGPGI